MDTNQYMDMFLDESHEHLQSLNDGLLSLEDNMEDTSVVNEIFRNAHTLKGMSATMGFNISRCSATSRSACSTTRASATAGSCPQARCASPGRARWTLSCMRGSHHLGARLRNFG